jgi:hypothetical protein
MRYALLLVAISAAVTVAAQSAVNIARQHANSVVTILTEDANRQSLSLGSGFIVSNGKIVTNYHVIEGAKYATALTQGGVKYPIDGVFAHSGTHDLAVLSAPGIVGNMSISSSFPEVGEKIYAIGSPEGLSNSISEGIVSGLRNMNGVQMIQISAAISSGSSGGPVFSDNGSVIGVAVGTLTSGQNLNFAIPTQLLIPLISKSEKSELASVPIRTQVPSSASTKSIEDGVSVIDMDLAAYSDYDDYGRNLGVAGHTLNGISLQNLTSYSVGRVKVIVILYNSKGSPVDFFKATLCQSGQQKYEPNKYDECAIIPSGLSKYYDFGDLNFDNPGLNKIRALDRRKGEKLVIRVLDFEIVRE